MALSLYSQRPWGPSRELEFFANLSRYFSNFMCYYRQEESQYTPEARHSSFQGRVLYEARILCWFCCKNNDSAYYDTFCIDH